MERTKVVTYQSCDLCDNPEETNASCYICHKYLCHNHQYPYHWGDQVYTFCSEHFALVSLIISQTGIPIGFVVYKLTAKVPNILREKEFSERGYSKLWKEEWTI